MLESLCGDLGVAAALLDGDGRVIWTSGFCSREFPGMFREGRPFAEALEECTQPERDPSPLGQPPSGASLRRARSPGGQGSVYRCLELPVEAGGATLSLRGLVNVSQERMREESFLLSELQLRSMREMVAILYESHRTEEVINLILVAVTSQMGFGFNRAFFLEVRGQRLCGRIGIGPSSHEEAHQIWSRLASLNFSTLREVYQDLTRHGEAPDPSTHRIAVGLDFDLRQLADASGGPLPGMLGALLAGKPARLHAWDPGTEVDATLFSSLRTDVVAVVPLFARGALAGVIIVDNLITRKPITEGDLNVLKTFAGYAGVALERSRLYDELRESLSKLTAAHQSLKANQQKLLQAEKLSALGELAAYVSHEIRNPLVAIGGLARSLLKDETHCPGTVETLDVIVSEVSRLERFLRETLEFVKPRATGMAPADLTGIVQECLATFRYELEAYSIEVERALGDEPLSCVTDPELFRQALYNLIKNAVEAMPSGGKLLIGVERNGAAVTVGVGDTGEGIPTAARAKIFEPFFTTKLEGTGLGLAIASHNIKWLGGKLELAEDARFKTFFKITLPLRTQQGGGHENHTGG
ncbi:MAG: hypothetical protein HY721_24985 [Planctomycetes bacterium]|nr:hypothetical protein [Planctomycetota bacterium]